MSIKILATADLHLGRSSADISGPCAPTRFIWRQIVSYCVNQQIDILALCGDIVDWDNRYFEAIGPLQEGFEELTQMGIKVYMVSGNHDFDVLPSIVSQLKSTNIRLLGAGGVWETEKFQKGDQLIQLAG